MPEIPFSGTVFHIAKSDTLFEHRLRVINYRQNLSGIRAFS